jgi:hypothetical protein
MSEQEEEKVGYRKPPAKTRFKPGQSGNLNGRPKGSVNLKTDLRSELSEKIRIGKASAASRSPSSAPC